MTMPEERTRALRWAGEFLREVRKTEGVPEELKRQAWVILRHTPAPEISSTMPSMGTMRWVYGFVQSSQRTEIHEPPGIRCPQSRLAPPGD